MKPYSPKPYSPCFRKTQGVKTATCPRFPGTIRLSTQRVACRGKSLKPSMHQRTRCPPTSARPDMRTSPQMQNPYSLKPYSVRFRKILGQHQGGRRTRKVHVPEKSGQVPNTCGMRKLPVPLQSSSKALLRQHRSLGNDNTLLNNKICTFKVLLSWRFPRKQRF